MTKENLLSIIISLFILTETSEVWARRRFRSPTPTPTPTATPTATPTPPNSSDVGPTSAIGCPTNSIFVTPGSSIQTIVNGAATNSVFCLKAGVHRMQAITPKAGQQFYGEVGTILNGSRLLTSFTREGSYYVATGQTQQSSFGGECLASKPLCNRPEALYINNQPMDQVSSLSAVATGKFYFDYSGDKIYFVDDPTGKTVEVTVSEFAFKSLASNVNIKNMVIEKYQNPVYWAAVMAEEASGWTVQNVEVRYSSGTAIALGSYGQLLNSKIHHNGQEGIAGGGTQMFFVGNEISYNNIYGYDPEWEAGAGKVTETDGVAFRNNWVHHNFGPGLWCDENVYNAVYEGNTVEYNQGPGIFHEISYNAIIRNNVLRYNGLGNKGWFWDADIQIAASQDVQIYGNQITTRANGNAIILIDQNRGPNLFGTLYKTQNNDVHNNTMTFDSYGAVGGVSDSEPGDANYSIIENGNNHFNNNIYRVKSTTSIDYSWGHSEYNISGFRSVGQEFTGQQILY